jgi:hypothetical protein
LPIANLNGFVTGCPSGSVKDTPTDSSAMRSVNTDIGARAGLWVRDGGDPNSQQ